MKTVVNIIQSKIEENVIFNIYKVTPFFESIINGVKNNDGSSYLIVNDLSENKQIKVAYHNIFYIEYVNRKLFVYIKENMYELKIPLYKLEKQLPNYFVRCSKSMIININEIKEFSSSLNGNVTAELLNNEKIIISRRYVKDIKEAFINI